MTEPNSPSIPPAAATSSPSVAPPDQEIVYYEGRPLLRAEQAKAAMWFIVGLVLVSLPILASIFEWTWWRTWMTIVAILGALLAIGLPWLLMRTTRYRVTNYRIDFERGILVKRIDTLELWHVDDIKFEQGLLDRIMNVGTITVISDDRTTPKLELGGIPDPRRIFDALKERIIAVKRQRGVLKMDMGQ